MTPTGKVLLAVVFMGGVAVGAASLWIPAMRWRREDRSALESSNSRVEELQRNAAQEKQAEAARREHAAASGVLSGAALEIVAAREPDARTAMERFAAAFREHGLDLAAGSDEDAAARWREHGSVEALAAFADEWFLAARAARRADRAARVLGVLLLADPDPTRVALRRALDAGDIAAARLAVEGVDATRASATARLHGTVMRSLGAPGEALESLRAARLARPNDVALLLELAVCSNGVERSECLAVAAALRPASAGLHALWAEALIDAGDRERALRICDRTLELSPSNALATELRSRALFEAGRADDALTVLRRALVSAPDDVRLRARFGALLAATGRDREAALELESVLERAPDHAGALRELARLRRDSQDSAVRDTLRAAVLEARAAEIESQ